MANFNNYDPLKVIVTLGPILFVGFVEGSMITVSRDNETFTKRTGAGGDVTRVRSHDRSGRVTVRLMQSSLTNDDLSARHRQDELLGTQYAPLMVKDLNGTTLMTAPNAWVVKPADIELAGNEASDREWMIDCDELIGVVGGAIA